MTPQHGADDPGAKAPSKRFGPSRRAKTLMPGGFIPPGQIKESGSPQGLALWGVSDAWSLKTVWGVGYKFEVVNS